MEHRYLLDTNILSNLIRKPHGIIAKKIAEVGEEAVCTSIIVSGELRFGAQKSQSKKLRKQVETILEAMEILPLDAPADQHYADIRLYLESMGTPIGPNDMLIGAQARSLGIAVVSANTVEFQRIPNLRVTNWLTQ